MCKLTQKLALFNYMIDKWTEEQVKIGTDNHELPKDEVILFEKKNTAIQKFSTTRFMKLAYFTCLESARRENEKAKNGDIQIEETLFYHFNNWVAYTNGGVEQDIYNHKEQMKTISKNEKFQYKLDENNNLKDELTRIIEKDNLSKYTKMIDDSIKSLINDEDGKSIPFDADDDIGKLIWLAHGELWNIAQWAENKEMFVNVPYFLQKELDKFKENKKHLTVNYKLAA
ncbi:MAG: hypothetical protein LBN95_10750 [Prevotellaceae bacterium]|jgi:hypothetical protein|nr:hypothetical protein [Prevotellaceae bacterium]